MIKFWKWKNFWVIKKSRFLKKDLNQLRKHLKMKNKNGIMIKDIRQFKTGFLLKRKATETVWKTDHRITVFPKMNYKIARKYNNIKTDNKTIIVNKKSTNFSKYKKTKNRKHQIHLITEKRNLTKTNINNKIIF